ncbi:autotransporter outer membrane beta-barrel domain-containing protein [Sphingorhabdus sp. EL138]|uniref:autotransporter outer membrane beta-barrel domain-containing protein n=1 Tax=Sphingorhabdus sp. EL138 TaxID=2073156 RepID=UPI000D687F87|nr:autotransporter outer membrane beta-barrel domain-containing protein [Sphingorhabdus sp. EL138]
MSFSVFSRSLFVTASSTACLAGLAVPAQAQTGPSIADTSAQSRPIMVENAPSIVIRDDLTLDDPPPVGVFDNIVDVTGVGQMTVRPDQNTTGLGLCTGTLINPRTVIFAAHCVNDQSAESYGFASGGTAIAFGFSADNRPAVRRWVGLDGGTANQTDVDFNIYNVEQVWYDERSIPTGFLEADVALATLDTHADGVPTWTLLFSPLREETHGVINGYGARGLGPDGSNLGIDFRRRIAENMISSASSLDDRNNFLFGPDDPALPQTLYNTDFDSPAGEAVFDPENGLFDFDLYDGAALPREGTTAGGDSGSALVADELFDKPVITSVLSGGSRFFGSEDDPNPELTFQPFSSYGTQSFYQPLYLFWDQIVANNSYVYASSRAGTRNWMNPRHWVQDMDPNYGINVDGELVNALPGFEAPGVTGDTPKFGNVCFLDDCLDLSTLSVEFDEGTPNSVFIEGGPGSRNFVPNNVVADPSAGVRARYYEVTLAASGATRLRDDVTIDRLNIEGAARLDIRRRGSLKVWGDYTQTGGWLDLRGTLTTGEAFLGVGLLTGNGLFDPTFLTSVNGSIAPGRNFGDTGTLTIAGDVILASGTLSIFDVNRSGNDKLAVLGDADNLGIISLGGTAAVVNAFGRNSARFGQTFEIVTAEGGVENTFDDVVGRIGVLYPELIYGPNNVTARMRAIRFSDFFSGNGIINPFSLAFASALDGARSSSYNDLSDVFGLIDVMEASQLSATFQNLSASQAGRTTTLDQQQGTAMRNLVSDRLSLLGAKEGVKGKIRIIGAPGVLNSRELTNSSASQLSFAGNYQSSDWNAVQLPENMSGFMSAGYDQSALAFGGNGAQDKQGSWHIAMGLEFGLDDRTTLGTAFGYADGAQQVSGSLANVETNQASVYGNYRLGGNFYIGGQASMSHSRIGSDSRISGGTALNRLDTNSLAFASEIEAGYNVDVDGLLLTPRASIGYSSYNVDGFRDSAGSLAMAVDEISRAGLEAKIGLKISGITKMGFASGWSFQPEMKLDFVNRISGNDTNFSVRFLDAENLPFALPIGLQDASYGEMKGGFNFTNGPLSFGAAIETRLGEQVFRDDRAVVNMAVRF